MLHSIRSCAAGSTLTLHKALKLFSVTVTDHYHNNPRFRDLHDYFSDVIEIIHPGLTAAHCSKRLHMTHHEDLYDLYAEKMRNTLVQKKMRNMLLHVNMMVVSNKKQLLQRRFNRTGRFRLSRCRRLLRCRSPQHKKDTSRQVSQLCTDAVHLGRSCRPP